MYGTGGVPLGGGRSRYRRKTATSEIVKRKYKSPKQFSGWFGLAYNEIYWIYRQIEYWLCFEYEDHDLDELDIAGTVRYKPDSLESIMGLTKFSRKEIQLMYRGFKQGSPNGIVNLAQFKEIYSQFFPEGDGKYAYAEFVFNTFDRDRNGQISFEEFVIGLSILIRGNLDDKLEWIFNLYDIHNRGCINRQELFIVINSIYDMMGKNTDPPVDELSVTEHVSEIFLKMDRDGDGFITKEEFMDACKEDKTIRTSLGLFDTRF